MSLIARYPMDMSRRGVEVEYSDQLSMYQGMYWAQFADSIVRPCAGPEDMAATKFRHSYMRLNSRAELSIPTTGYLFVGLWVRPDVLTFAHTEGSGYVHLVAKGMTTGEYEWAVRMYSADNAEGRRNRISCYVFNPRGELGVGSYFQHDLEEGGWLHVGAEFNLTTQRTTIHRDGHLCDSDSFAGLITPQACGGPVEVARRGDHGYFEGALADLRFYNLPPNDEDWHSMLYPNGYL